MHSVRIENIELRRDSMKDEYSIMKESAETNGWSLFYTKNSMLINSKSHWDNLIPYVIR